MKRLIVVATSWAIPKSRTDCQSVFGTVLVLIWYCTGTFSICTNLYQDLYHVGLTKKTKNAKNNRKERKLQKMSEIYTSTTLRHFMSDMPCPEVMLKNEQAPYVSVASKGVKRSKPLTFRSRVRGKCVSMT